MKGSRTNTCYAFLVNLETFWRARDFLDPNPKSVEFFLSFRSFLFPIHLIGTLPLRGHQLF